MIRTPVACWGIGTGRERRRQQGAFSSQVSPPPADRTGRRLAGQTAARLHGLGGRVWGVMCAQHGPCSGTQNDQLDFMATELQERASGGVQKLAGKYLTFTLQRESYGIDVLKIREIIRLTNITAVPQMPDYVRGVINLRGKIIPVIDLR